MKIRHLIYLFPLVFLIISGCAQREADIGSNAIVGTPGNKFAILSGSATHGTDWHAPYTNGGGKSLEVGNAQNMYSFFAIRFNARAGLPDSVQVDTLRVRLCRGKVWPGGALPGLQVTIREIPDSVSWTEGALVPGMMAGREQYPVLDLTLVASATDSFFTFTLANPQEIWHRWHTDSTNHGMIIEPRAGSSGGMGGFIEFYSREGQVSDHPEYAPALFIHGRAWVSDSTFSPDTSVTTYATDDGFLVIDSTEINPVSRDQHRGHLLVTQGLPQRAALYFPVDTIVTTFSRSVNRAELHLFADTTSPLRMEYPEENMSVNHGFLTDSTWITHPDSLQLSRLPGPEAGATGYGYWDITNSELVFDVTGAVAFWISNPARNGGMQIFSADELNNLAREAFYGADADSATLYNKRPKLYIWYTEISH